MIGHSDDHLIGGRSQHPPLGFNDAVLCLALLIFLIVVPAVIAMLLVMVGEFAIAHIALPPFIISPN
jgi:hypothetical protein